GGTNPAQVGLGVTVAGISQNFTQGASELTGRATDLSIQGDGLFVVRKGAEQLYTRDGSLNFDALGRLTTADGAVLQGWAADASGTINANAAVGDISMPLGQTTAPTETANIKLGGNLPADAAVGTSFTYTTTAADTWTVTATMPDTGGGPDVTVGTATLNWDSAATPPAF